MRLLLSLLFLVFLCSCGRAQVGAQLDAEYASWCMVDSIGPGNVVRFSRLVNISTLDVVDIDPVAGAAYTIAGTILTCEAYDLAQSMRDPLEDLYSVCQCQYSIGQENNRVTNIQGGALQLLTVQFEEVIRRQCTGESEATVIRRNTLTETAAIPTLQLTRGVAFNANGQHFEHVDYRIYTNGSSSIIRVDLDPATVQASYPGLTVNVTDLTYDGTNHSLIAAEVARVSNYAIQQIVGVTTNTIVASTSNASAGIRMVIQHQPIEPYIMFPDELDSDFSIVSTKPGNSVSFGFQESSFLTQTTEFTEECASINDNKTGFYLSWNYLTPLELVAVLSPELRDQTSTSNPAVFCDAAPSVCASLATSPVTIDSCVNICSDVLNIAGNALLVDVDTTLATLTYNSVSVYVKAGPVSITADGQTVEYPTGYVTSWAAQEAKLITNVIRINATGGEATINYVR